MVEVGELNIVGSIDTRKIDEGFQRVDNEFSQVQTQSEQTDASLGVLAGTVGKLGVGLAVAGVAGVTAMTGLASKAPVLAGTMSKIDVEMLKLSNTVGRQMKPIFDAVANDLIPSLNSAFSSNSETVTTFTQRVSSLVGAIADLIGQDYEGLGRNLDIAFGPGDLPRATAEETRNNPFRETKERFSSILNPPEVDNNVQRGSIQYQMERYGNLFALPVNAVVDFFQWLGTVKDNKEGDMVTANGVTR